jgi:ATP-dependent RNA helicase SUPV3L1/SUV3
MTITFSSPAARDFRKDARQRGAGVTAVLGPTNTGKTHLAIERMLAHSSGIIGLPLRLLAREVYNKAVDRVGTDAVALVTGEEKIKPANPRFWVSTVEAMPRDLDVAFVAIDEVQLGADLERGHVFTDRALNRRGREETLVLGAATVRPMVEKLLPGAHILTRPRLSQLSFAGEKKITRLPRRSAIVAFSAEEVYAIAELIRRQRGGAAVVLGALSPRTRNAQVALYQDGEVEYLVATDAIGMGLNLDVDHVAFASDRKFDGYQFRKLNPAELAQIAGRAGRATRDGTFGTTGRCPAFEPELAQQLESHSFEPVKILQWRNSDLDFASIGALQASLAATPTESGLTRAPVGEDILVLDHAARDEEVRAMANSRAAVELLWDVCQVPDYRKIAPATHAELAVTLYGFLMRDGKIPTDWFARQVAQNDLTEGGIDALSNRIAHVRTWTFAANRPDWLADPEHWQAVTRGVEDKLSDALHERLTERFVDRRTSVLMRRLRENAMLETEIKKTGEVVVEGHMLGRLEGFSFAADAAAAGSDAKALQAAAQKALAGEIDARAAKLSQAPDEQFVLTSDGTIRWLGDAVGKLTAGDDALRPRVRIIADEQLTGAARDAVQARLDLWLKAHIDKLLGPLLALGGAEDVTGIARGIAFQLVEALGVLERSKVAEDVKSLDQGSRATLRKYGLRFGAYHLYIPALLKPAPRALAAQLWTLKHDSDDKGLIELQHLAASGRTSMPVDQEVSIDLYRAVGYRVCGERAIRVDMLERLADLIRPALAWRSKSPGMKPPGALDGSGFTVTGAMTSLVGASGDDFASVLRSLGYRMERRPKPPDPVIETKAETSEPREDAGIVAEAVRGDRAASASTETETPATARQPAVRASKDENDAANAVSVSKASDASTQLAGESEDFAEQEDATEAQVRAADHDYDHAEPQIDIVGVAFAGGVSSEQTTDDAPIVETAAVAASAEEALQSLTEQTDHQTNMPAAALTDDQTNEQTAKAAEQAKAEPVAPTEPELIEVWRPSRFDRTARSHRTGPRHPPRHDRRHDTGDARPGAPAVDMAETGQAAAPSTDAAPDRRPPRKRAEHPHRASERPNRNEQRQDRGERGSRPPRPPRFEGRRSEGGGKPFSQSAPPPRRDREPDPNSPFAKLAALKAQLEADAKERR